MERASPVDRDECFHPGSRGNRSSNVYVLSITWQAGLSATGKTLINQHSMLPFLVLFYFQ